MPTTRSEARRVPAKSEEVDRDRGCRCGGIVAYDVRWTEKEKGSVGVK
jgi:HrpA-like RNA helicase